MSETEIAPIDQWSLRDLIIQAGALCEEGRDLDALKIYDLWIDAHPDDPLTHAALFNQSTLYSARGDHAAAITALKWSLALKPDFLPSAINLGRAFEQIGATDQAITIWTQAAERPMQMTALSMSHMTTLLKQFARVLLDREDFDLAEQVLTRSIGLNPSQDETLEQYLALRMRELRWPVLSPLETLDGPSMLARFHPLSVAAFSDDPLLQLACGHDFEKRTLGKETLFPATHDRRAAAIESRGRRLRIGYVSSDLRDHAIGFLMAEFFEQQDKSRLETFAYVTGPAPLTEMSQRIEAAVDHWVDIRAMSDDDAAAHIARDEIDILVDVNGHTRDGRIGVFARRPAPIQVNWLGFPGTMGTPYHHYIIADAEIIPPELEHYYSERVVRLPCYQPNDRKRAIAHTPPPARARYGLPDEAFVFCSFNAFHKFSRFTIERWAAILRQTPGSVLWLLDGSATAKANLGAIFEKHGVARDRLIHATKVQNPHHLARLPLADLVLDSLPYGAHTTASDALWMGVPVLTLRGRSFAARVCASLVTAAGTPEMVTTTPDDFIDTAVMLAREPGQIGAVRAKLATAKSSCLLFDQAKLANAIADLFAQMVADYQAGNLPQPDLRNMDAYMRTALDHDHEATELSFMADYDANRRAALTEIDRRIPLETDTRLWRRQA